jgi:hypothetical protein
MAAGGRRVERSRKVASGSSRRVTRRLSCEHASTPSRARSLVGERGVDVAVADDVGAALERRPDHLSTCSAREAAKSAASAHAPIAGR